MSTTLEVNKKSVKELLENGVKNRFVIPEYQRPYAWTDEEVQTLFDDLVEYTSNHQGEQSDSSYFLGTIVSYNNQSEQEIIDGQQRITTLFLLLRALYTKLSKSTETDEVENFKGQIAPAIWKRNRLSGKVNFSDTLITSRVMNTVGNEVFAKILETGETELSNDDNYSKNYRQLQDLIEAYSQKEPLLFYHLIDNILNNAILLPIKADSQDTALTIFSTLNDRGLPLSDADIFKAKIYNNLDMQGKELFISEWQELDEHSTESDETVQRLFYYYMFYLRALENDKKSTTPGLRKYYSQNQFERLYEPNIMSNLSNLLNLWSVVNTKISLPEEKWSENMEVLQTLDMLSSYPNEFWKYPISIYYLQYSKRDDFDTLFLNFSRKLFVHLAARYIVTPTINAVKTAIMNLNSSIIESPEPKFTFAPVTKHELKENMKNPHRNTVRMILKFIAYREQDTLLPNKWEIEHIFPKKWQTNYFVTQSDEEVKEIVEYIGNKIPFEKKLNIVAGNGYFLKKKVQYAQSDVKIVKYIANSAILEWDLEDIRERNIRINDAILETFTTWGIKLK